MVQEAGLEVMSGCMALMASPFILVAVLVARARARKSEPHQRLVAMLRAFVFHEDRSEWLVRDIFKLLMKHFHGEADYERLSVAISSFVPGGKPPFPDEKRLEAEFRHFLKMQQEDEGAWPPPPRNRPEEGQ